MTGWSAIPDGYYAVPDPADPQVMTYWRRRHTSTTDSLRSWPATAWYGPAVPRRSELPEDPAERQAFADAWSATRNAYHDQIVVAILTDTAAAAKRFADLRTACSQCGRRLRDAESKLYAVGPDCRALMDPVWLGRIRSAEVGRAHAEQLATP